MKIVPQRKKSKQNKTKKPTQRKSIKQKKQKKSKKNTLFNKISSNNGYCEASILDDNDKNIDPCHFYDSENKCASETNENDFIRSYKCKWINK